MGGLWPNHEQAAQTRTTAGRPGTLDPRMRTNLSRFTVAFSDLSWETVMGDADIPMFPQACQVGRYLAAYAERYIPKDVLRLGCRVIRTVRAAGSDCGVRWRVDWIQERCVPTPSAMSASFIDVCHQPVPSARTMKRYHQKTRSYQKILTFSLWHRGTSLVPTFQQSRDWRNSQGKSSIALPFRKDVILFSTMEMA